MVKKWWIVAVMLTLWVFVCSAEAETIIVSPGELTTALEQAQQGDVLVLKAGTYAEPQEQFPLHITQGITICAMEGETPVIDAPPFQSAFRVDAADVTLQGLDIQFRRTGLYLTGDNLRVENCSIALADPAWRTSSCGAWLGGIKNAVFRSCAFTDCAIAVAGPPLTERSRSLPVLTGLFEVGEEREFFNTHTIENCTVNGKPLFYAASQEKVIVPEDAGMIFVADCADVTVKNADVSHTSMGMEIIYCDHVSVENSRADYCGVFGIYFAKLGSGEMVECSAVGTNHGLDIRASRNITLLRCTANNCDQGLFFSHVDQGLMQDCTVADTGQGYFLAGGNDCQLNHCTAIACENGFNIQKENNVLVNECILRGCTVCAARLDGSPVTFVNNLLEDNWVAVMAYGEVPYVLANNTIRRSESCGLYLRDIAFSRITGNTIAESKDISVQASGEMNESLLAANSFDKPIQYLKNAAVRTAQ